MLVASILFFGRNFALLCEKNEIEMCSLSVNFDSFFKKLKINNFAELILICI
jgi:hypothetical protein